MPWTLASRCLKVIQFCPVHPGIALCNPLGWLGMPAPQGPEFHLVCIGELDYDGDTFRSYVHAFFGYS